MPDPADEWLVMSRLTAFLPLGDGRFVAAHILGRSRAIGDGATAALLEWFSVPRRIGALRAPIDAPHETLDRMIEQLRAAGLLRSPGQREDERLRSFYGLRLREPERANDADRSTSRSHPRWLCAEGGCAPASLAQLPDIETSLALSSSLAVLPLERGEVLVTHPLHTPVHMTSEIWALARLFERSRRIADALVEFDATGLSQQEALHVCGCLQRWFLLWTSPQAEAARARAMLGPADRCSLRIEYPAEARWRQKFAAYTLNDIKRCHAAGSVALIGPCQLQLAAEALQVLAQRSGVFLEVVGLLDIEDPRLSRTPWSLIVLSSTQFAASLYEALAAEDLQRVERIALGVAAHIDAAVDRIRHASAAPLLLTAISLPGLAPAGPESPFWHASAALLARLNAQLALSLARRGSAWLVDEGRLAAELSPGIYWDDEFNALPHHSAASNWSWLVMKPDWVATASREGAFEGPAVPATQIDPAYVLGSTLLRTVERLHVENPVRLIVFEPNGLLWRGRLEERLMAYPTPPHFYADVEDYRYAGIHEALAVLRRRGVQLACASSCPATDLFERWTSPTTLKHLVRLDDLVAIEGGAPWPDRLQAILDRTGVDAAQVLVIAFPPPELEGFRGRIYSGEPHALRRYLLTTPALNPLPGSIVDAEPAARAALPRDAPASASLEAHSVALDDEVLRLIAAALRVSPGAVRRCEDLRFLGLDSIGGVDLMCALETRFGFSFQDHQIVEPIMFFPQPLLEAVREGLRTKSQSRRRPRAPRDDCYGGRDYQAWCAADLASILEAHIASPPIPWIFKVLESGAPGDARFLTWKDLGERARGYAAACAAAGASPGERVALAIPVGAELISAFVGAVRARYVPCVFPPFPLAPDSLRHVLSTVRPTLLICEPSRAPEITAALRAVGFSGEIVAGPATGSITWPARAPHAPLLLQQSSGTTGSRKAVELDDRRVLSQIWQIAHAVECTPRDRVATWLPMYHDMGFICTLVLPLALSLPTVVMAAAEWVRSPHLLLREISAEKTTLTWMPNFALALSARRVDERDLAGLDLSTLRVLVNGGEPVTGDAIAAFARRFAPYGLHPSALSSGYGAAEATAAITQSMVGRSPVRLRVAARVLEHDERVLRAAPEQPDEEVRELVSSGRALSHTRIRIADASGGSLTDGEVGEIVISGDAVAQHYEADPAATARAFRHGEFYTGDLGFRMDEEIFVTGRRADLIVLAGRKLHPHDLEATAAELDAIHDGRVVAMGVPTHDGSTQRLVILAEPQLKELTADEQEKLEMSVAARLFERWRVAATVEIVPRGTLIKTSSGKPSRARNRALYLQRLATGGPVIA